MQFALTNMENTLENKAKFFALYYGQKVRLNKPTYGSPRLVKVEKSILNWLHLKPLSRITDEDKKKITEYTNLRMNRTTLRHEWESKDDAEIREYIENTIHVNSIDYLRSKGYALPWMGLSVERLIEYKWIKI